MFDIIAFEDGDQHGYVYTTYATKAEADARVIELRKEAFPGDGYEVKFRAIPAHRPI